MLRIFAGIAVAMLLGGCDVTTSSNRSTTSTATTTTASSTSAVNGVQVSRFDCAKSASSFCNYVLFTSTCSDGVGSNGRPSLTCVHQVVEEFSLREGESKEFSALPAGYRICSSIGEKPVFPKCAA
jgi:hypothetical protein